MRGLSSFLTPQQRKIYEITKSTLAWSRQYPSALPSQWKVIYAFPFTSTHPSNYVQKCLALSYALIVGSPLIEAPNIEATGDLLIRFSFMASFSTLSTLSLIVRTMVITSAMIKIAQGTAIQRIRITLITRNPFSRNQLVITGSTKSPIEISLEKRFRIRPTGFESKKETLERRSVQIIQLWSFYVCTSVMPDMKKFLINQEAKKTSKIKKNMLRQYGSSRSQGDYLTQILSHSEKYKLRRVGTVLIMIIRGKVHLPHEQEVYLQTSLQESPPSFFSQATIKLEVVFRSSLVQFFLAQELIGSSFDSSSFSCFFSLSYGSCPFNSISLSDCSSLSRLVCLPDLFYFERILERSSSVSSSSQQLPKNFTSPQSRQRIQSALGRMWSWCVTKILVFSFKQPFIACYISLEDTLGSTAERGSSSKQSAASEQSALASEMRAFWPPLRLMPRSPISVCWPRASWSQSSSRQANLETESNFSESQGSPNKILF